MTRTELRTFFVSALGGALEFFDFIIYVFFAGVIGKLFFHSNSEIATLLFAFNVYASGYAARFLGGIIFSHYGDRFGRKNNLSITIFLMAIPTFAIGFLPTYEQIGLTATVLLVLCRIGQGFALGGELPCALTFVFEHAKKEHRSFALGILFCGVTFGVFLGSFVGALITHNLTEDQLYSWGWRVAFMSGGILGGVGFYLRKRLSESPLFKRFKNVEMNDIPFTRVIKSFKLNLLKTTGAALVMAVAIAINYLYLPTYLQTFLKFKADDVLLVNCVFVFIFSFLILGFAKLCDLWGEKYILMLSLVGFILFSVPLFSHLVPQDPVPLFIFYIVMTILTAAITSCVTVYMGKAFPTKIRYSGVSLSYNLAFGLIGGFTPAICTKLIQVFQTSSAPSFYLIFVAVLAFLLNFKSVKEYE